MAARVRGGLKRGAVEKWGTPPCAVLGFMKVVGVCRNAFSCGAAGTTWRNLGGRLSRGFVCRPQIENSGWTARCSRFWSRCIRELTGVVEATDYSQIGRVEFDLLRRASGHGGYGVTLW